MITLYQQIYNTTPEVESFVLYCINKNIKNKYIDNIVYLLEDLTEKPSFVNDKIKYKKVNDRISYKDWLDISKNDCGVKVLANSDVYFDESIKYLENVEWKNVLVVLSRKELKKNGEIVSGEVFYDSEKKINPIFSQDAWAYKDELVDFDCNYKLGFWHCESNFRSEAIKAGIKIKNLININVIHVDWRMRDSKKHPSYEEPKIDVFDFKML